MSGPVRPVDVAGVPATIEHVDEHVADTGDPAPPPAPHVLEVTPGRESVVGETTVRRSLPTRRRRTVGPWCFLDHAPEVLVDGGRGMQVGPHPHIGLQTVTWLLDGEVVHRDSLGSEQTIRPGQLNVMSAGNGVVHAEETPPTYRGSLHAVQLWVAQPEATRHGPPAFEHHTELPQLELGTATATVMTGAVEATRSPARTDGELVGVDLELRPGRTVVPLRHDFEHALVLLFGTVGLDDTVVAPDQLAYLGSGRSEIAITASVSARALLVGGTPFESTPLMWWNFVARDRDEVSAAYSDWQGDHERFGRVESGLDAVPAPPPPWLPSPAPFRTR